MNAYRYIATLSHNNSFSTQLCEGNNLHSLIARLLAELDREATSMMGFIKDNLTGQILHRFRKASVE